MNRDGWGIFIQYCTIKEYLHNGNGLCDWGKSSELLRSWIGVWGPPCKPFVWPDNLSDKHAAKIEIFIPPLQVSVWNVGSLKWIRWKGKRRVRVWDPSRFRSFSPKGGPLWSLNRVFWSTILCHYCHTLQRFIDSSYSPKVNLFVWKDGGRFSLINNIMHFSLFLLQRLIVTIWMLQI